MDELEIKKAQEELDKKEEFEYHASSVIKLNIEDFTGPIDLLYYIIVSKDNYNIANFPLHLITDQYMEYMKQLDKVDVEIAAEFIVYASKLLDYKARYLAYMQNNDVDDEDGIPLELDDNGIRRQLQFKYFVENFPQKLKSIEKLNQFHRNPKYTDDDAIIVINNFDKKKLIASFEKVLFKMDEKEASQLFSNRVIKNDPYTVEQKSVYIAKKLLKNKKAKFKELFENDTTKGEIVATFQAILELTKRQFLIIKQDTLESDIEIDLSNKLDVDNVNLEEFLSEEKDNG